MVVNGRQASHDEALRALQGGPVVKMRADEMAPFGWRPAMVLVAIGVVDRIDASIVTGILPVLRQEWGFSDTLGGAIPFAALAAGAVVSLPAGYLADRYDRTRLLALVLASWALLTMVSALALSFWMFFAIRTVLGAADHLDNPAASSLMADYYPPRARGKAFGYQRMGYYVGISLGALIGGVFGELFGWRAAFLVMVLPGLAVAALCWILREPIRGAIDRFVATQGNGDNEVSNLEANAAAESWVTAAEAGDAGATRDSMFRQVVDLMRVRTIKFLFIGVTVVSFGLSGISFWLPSYYERHRGLGEAAAGGLTALVSLVGIIGGAYVGGFLGDRYHRAVRGGRLLVAGIGLLTGSLVLLVSFDTPTLVLHLTVLTVAIFCMSVAPPTLSAAIADILAAEKRGVGFAFFTVLATAGAALGPLAVGLVSDYVTGGQLKTAFYVLVIPSLVGSFMVLTARNSFDSDADHVLATAKEEPGLVTGPGLRRK